MRLKRDYMGNDQLLPAYNLQTAICDEYIAVIDVKPYASDMECFVPLVEKFNRSYGHYPKMCIRDRLKIRKAACDGKALEITAERCTILSKREIQMLSVKETHKIEIELV